MNPTEKRLQLTGIKSSKIQQVQSGMQVMKQYYIPQNINNNDQNKQEIILKLLQQNNQLSDDQNISNRKRLPNCSQIKQNSDLKMDIVNINNKNLRFQDLPEELVFYIIDIYQYFNRLFISGVMPNGQTIGIIANDPCRDLFFSLKKQSYQTHQVSEEYMKKAKLEIDTRLRQLGINPILSRFVQLEYVFEIDEIPRGKRPYYQIRYPYRVEANQMIKPDMEGEYFKYVFGTTYTPMQLFIINSKIKGPCWVKVHKKFLTQPKNKVSECCLCAQIINPQQILPLQQNKKPPTMRVMSLSIKSIIPSKVRQKKLFPTNRIDENHIYTISYNYCQSYFVQFKPNKPSMKCKTFYLKSLIDGQKKIGNDYVSCTDQRNMFDLFLQDLKICDPDFIVCHDAAQIVDTLILRMAAVIDKSSRPRLGRLIYNYDLNKNNQQQRINSSLAGRILVDTFIHSKDMIKQVDYSLQSMSKYIKPQKVFKGLTDDQINQYLNIGKTIPVINICRDQSTTTFSLMNHLQVLQMTKSLSNICGNIWKRSLENQRAQRNQYLIMHQCKNRDLVIPDKYKVVKGEQAQEGDRKKYTGGLVLNPQTGMYSDFILLLDFNSLYPSLIRQYNICFSVIKRPKLPFSYYYKNKDQKKKKGNKEQGDQQNKIMDIENQAEDMVQPPPAQQCKRQKWGFLPYLIDKIVERRKKCKQQMKKASAERIIILDIQQKCYKVVANSIYGCLGFKFNRFYSKHLAALVTRMGRQALVRARDIVNNRGIFKVIYGDTDSLMIQPLNLSTQTNKQKVIEIKNLAKDLKKQINQQYTNLEIDIDGIYKPLILLQKKKYVANKLNNFDDVIFSKAQPQFSLEYKGVQVVRRDGCPLSRTTLKQVIDILMKGSTTDLQQLQSQLIQYFAKLKQKLATIDFRQFLLANFLSKKPREYAQGQNISHVKVALDRIKNGEKQQTLVGHIIYYIICLPRNQTEDSYAKRSWDDKTFEKSQKFDKMEEKLKIDYQCYKVQILRPVARILGTIKINMDRISQAMDIKDPINKQKIKKFTKDQDDNANPNTQSNILEVILNRDFVEKSKKLQQQLGQYRCCNQSQSLLFEDKFRLSCQNKNCNRNLITILCNKINLLIKKKVMEYYNNNYKCKCSKQYLLTPIVPCCKIKYRQKSSIPYILHDLLYLCIDLSNATKKIANGKNLERLESMDRVIQKFLEESNYQNVEDLLKKMSF